MSIQTEGMPDGTVREYGRRLYVDESSESFVDSMRRVTDKAIYNQQTQAHSELKKPYISEDYQEMEYFYSPPYTNFAWSDWVWPDFKGPAPTTTTDTQWFSPDWIEGEEEGGEGLVYCSITCNGNRFGECSDPIECRCVILSNPGVDAELGRWTVTLKGGGAVISAGWTFKYVGGLYPVEIHPPGGSWENVIDEGETQKKLQVWFHDANGAVCSYVVTVYCSCCPAAVTFEFDDGNTPDTIVKNSYINVYVVGGCAPFTYNVGGTGYTWQGSGTNQSTIDGRGQRLNCADGTCGVNYDAVASITITDDCGTVVTADIRNTSGEWGPAVRKCYVTYYPLTDIINNTVGKYRYKMKGSVGCNWPGGDYCDTEDCNLNDCAYKFYNYSGWAGVFSNVACQKLQGGGGAGCAWFFDTVNGRCEISGNRASREEWKC